MHLPRRAVLVMASSLMTFGVLVSLGTASASASAQTHHSAGATTVSSPALSFYGCPSGSFCGYQNKNYNVGDVGGQWNYSYNGYKHDSWIWVGGAANDKISSIINYRAAYSAVQKDNTETTEPNACADIPGNDNIAGDTVEISDLYGTTWPDPKNGSMNDSISAIMLKSSDYPSCNQVTF
jgi:hypothetical protein